MDDLIDEPRAVRSDDALDIQAVQAWLQAQCPDLIGMPEVRQFRGGASNLTYLLRWGGPGDGPGRELILRRPPFGRKAKSAHDMGREVRFLTALRPVYEGLPEVVAHCEDPSVANGEFYVMERLRGVILRQDIPDALELDVATDPTPLRQRSRPSRRPAFDRYRSARPDPPRQGRRLRRPADQRIVLTVPGR